jgi:DNA-binding beta-propeller fold protein YncE
MWGSGGTAAGQLNYPCGIAVEPSGNVIVADLTPRVQRFTASGSYLGTLAVGGSGEGQLGSCCWTQVDVDPDGRIFVTDIGNNRILVFAADGSFGAQWGSLGSGPGQFNLPTGLTIDSYDNVYVFDRGNSRVEKFGYVTPTLSTSWGRLKAIYK